MSSRKQVMKITLIVVDIFEVHLQQIVDDFTNDVIYGLNVCMVLGEVVI